MGGIPGLRSDPMHPMHPIMRSDPMHPMHPIMRSDPMHPIMRSYAYFSIYETHPIMLTICNISLQKFKLNIANTVICQDNSSLRSMNTSDLLDLFQVSGSQQQRKEKNKVYLCIVLIVPLHENLFPFCAQDGAGSTRGSGAEGGGSGGMKKVLENLPELWDDQQYSNEYDLSGFMKSLTAVEK